MDGALERRDSYRTVPAALVLSLAAASFFREGRSRTQYHCLFNWRSPATFHYPPVAMPHPPTLTLLTLTAPLQIALWLWKAPGPCQILTTLGRMDGPLVMM